ncbi:hypothetical protein PR048_000657 [Dryococelus australis]|uniref:Uncharacterized protein n=1 Tax=Dryococelus australis TaxID=614101 RepID=A0ABQ9IFA5_9NEOP|nr:hypothetical protein PR048_000657 [Dryococelus australis]
MLRGVHENRPKGSVRILSEVGFGRPGISRLGRPSSSRYGCGGGFVAHPVQRGAAGDWASAASIPAVLDARVEVTRRPVSLGPAVARGLWAWLHLLRAGAVHALLARHHLDVASPLPETCETGKGRQDERRPTGVYIRRALPRTCSPPPPQIARSQEVAATLSRGSWRTRFGGDLYGAGKREIPEKTRRPTASSSTIPTCENPVTRPGIEPGSPWWEASVLIAQPQWPRGVGGSTHLAAVSRCTPGSRRACTDPRSPTVPPRSPSDTPPRTCTQQNHLVEQLAENNVLLSERKFLWLHQINCFYRDNKLTKHRRESATSYTCVHNQLRTKKANGSCSDRLCIDHHEIECRSPSANTTSADLLSKANRVRFPVGSLPDFRKWESCPDDVAGKLEFSGISRFPRPYVSASLRTHIASLHRRQNLSTPLHCRLTYNLTQTNTDVLPKIRTQSLAHPVSVAHQPTASREVGSLGDCQGQNEAMTAQFRPYSRLQGLTQLLQDGAAAVDGHAGDVTQLDASPAAHLEQPRSRRLVRRHDAGAPLGRQPAVPEDDHTTPHFSQSEAPDTLNAVHDKANETTGSRSVLASTPAREDTPEDQKDDDVPTAVARLQTNFRHHARWDRSVHISLPVTADFQLVLVSDLPRLHKVRARLAISLLQFHHLSLPLVYLWSHLHKATYSSLCLVSARGDTSLQEHVLYVCYRTRCRHWSLVGRGMTPPGSGSPPLAGR